jgi:hypothetical protein
MKMNNELKYERLKRITETQKPWRGTIDKYPFSDRNHNYKYFYPREVNGEIEYHVGYYHKWEMQSMTTEEFNTKKSSMDSKELKKWREQEKWNTDARTYEPTGYYEKDVKNPKVDLIIRSDNTVEIVTDNFHQGMRMIFSAYSYSNGVFQSSVNHGGIVYGRRDNGVDIRIPIFKHMRFNMDTMAIHESSKYLATYKTVDRKKSKEAMGIYQDKLNGAFAFISCMDKESFLSDMSSVLQDLFPKDSEHYYWGKEKQDNAISLADNIFFKKPVEAIYAYMKAFRVSYYLGNQSSPSAWLKGFKKKFAKHINVKHDTFTKDYLTHLENFKSSPWNIDITIDGKMVERLT